MPTRSGLPRAGRVPLGGTAVGNGLNTTPEFGAWGYTASPLTGVTRNPWNPDRTPGGSSGGTAAAVSAGVLPFGTASDGGGSIRGPGSSCGLPGLKPTYGRVPTFGVTRHAQNAVNFALATTVADTALLLDLAAGPDHRDRTCLPPPGVRYTDVIEQLDVAGLRAESLPLAVKIAETPQAIRGFGHVKDASVKTAKAAEDALWARWGAA